MKDSLGIRRKSLTLTCSNCSRQFKKPIARLDDDSEMKCPHCNFLFKIDKLKLTNNIEKALDEFKKRFRDLGKY